MTVHDRTRLIDWLTPISLNTQLQNNKHMTLEYWQLALLAFVGIGSGWLNVMAGGGSLLTIPIMLFLGIPAPVANGTNRIGILFQNISAVIGFFRNGFSDFKLSLTLAICASIGATGGAMIGVRLEGVWFNYILIAVMVGVMLITAFGKTTKISKHNAKPKRLLLGHICMIGAGFWGGFIQIGVGFILMPILSRIMGLDLVRTNMHKVTVVLAYTIVALTIFASQVQVLWIAGFVLAIGTSIGGYLGAHTSVKKGDVWIKRVLNIALLAFIIKLLYDAA